MSTRLFAFTLIIALAVILPSSGEGQIPRTELHPIPSLTLTDQQFLTGAKDGQPVVVVGELRLPQPGTNRLPTVVLLHGSGGVGANVTLWANELNAMGIATLIVDSFTGRKLVTTSSDQAQLGRLAMIVDGYRALALLAQHPRVNANKVALMGFSRGGQAALYASLKRFQRMHSPQGAEYAAYLPFYAPCNTTFVDDGDVSERPIRLFHGAADDYVPVAPCRAYVARLRAAGKDVQLTEYAGAPHVFDNPLLNPPRTAPTSQMTRGCVLEENPIGQIINTRTRQPFNYADPCIERGPTLGYHAQAHAEAVKDVKEFLGTTFKLK